MGLISKIEEKLSGSSHKHDDEKHGNVDRQGVSTAQQQSGTMGSHAQQPIESNAATQGSGITGGTALGGSNNQPYSSHTGTGSHLSNTTGTHGQGSHLAAATTADSNPSTQSSGITGGSALGGLNNHPNSNFTGPSTQGNHLPAGTTSTTGQGSHLAAASTTTTTSSHTQRGNDIDTGSRDHTSPRQPMNPYTSQGQQTAAHAADSRLTASSNNPTREAGLTNPSGGGGAAGSINDRDFITGPHSALQNPNAIPTAGGQRVGSNATGPYDSTSAPDPSRGQQGVVRASDPTRTTVGGSHLLGESTTFDDRSGLAAQQQGMGFANSGGLGNASAPPDTPLAQDVGFVQRHQVGSAGLR